MEVSKVETTVELLAQFDQAMAAVIDRARTICSRGDDWRTVIDDMSPSSSEEEQIEIRRHINQDLAFQFSQASIDRVSLEKAARQLTACCDRLSASSDDRCDAEDIESASCARDDL